VSDWVFFFFFLSLYPFPPKGALGYEAIQIGLILHGCIAMLDPQNEHYACYILRTNRCHDFCLALAKVSQEQASTHLVLLLPTADDALFWLTIHVTIIPAM